MVAAICAAPTVLAEAGILKGKQFTCYANASYLELKAEVEGKGGMFENQPVVVSGHVITSQGPGTAIEFGLAIVQALSHDKGPARVEKVKNAMLMPHCVGHVSA